MDLFIGLVTHNSTTFPESASPEGLASKLCGVLRTHGRSCRVEVFDEDRWAPEVLSLGSDEIRNSMRAELAVEREWRDFHGGGSFVSGHGLTFKLRQLSRWSRFHGLRSGSRAREQGRAMLRRLVNIEIAHLTLMNRGLESQADWVLILEDDASADVGAAARMLEGLIAERGSERQPLFVNMSRSFNERELGVQSSLLPPIALTGGEFTFVPSVKPMTNTVCAVLYRRSFLVELCGELDRISVDPVLPIDWKLNAALMAMHSRNFFQPGDTWTCVDSPIVQGSMHPRID